MDNVPNTNLEPVVINSPPENMILKIGKFYLIKWELVALILLLILSLILTYVFTPQRITKEKPIFSLPTEKINLPISLDLLQDPAFSNWSAQIMGKITSKSLDSITLNHVVLEASPSGKLTFKDSSDNQTLKINVIINTTSFVSSLKTKEATASPTSLSLNQLKTGDILIGQVKLEKVGSDWQIIGGKLTVQ